MKVVEDEDETAGRAEAAEQAGDRAMGSVALEGDVPVGGELGERREDRAELSEVAEAANVEARVIE